MIRNGKIIAPVSICDIIRLLRSKWTSLSRLCTDETINKWSLHKPIEAKKIGQLSDAEIYLNNAGLEPPIDGDYDDDTLQREWAYNRPFGGINSPYRQEDFADYNHDAKVPLFVQLEQLDGARDSQGRPTRNPKVRVTFVINDKAEIDIRRMNMFTPSETGMFVRVRPRDGRPEYYFGLDENGRIQYPMTNLVNEALIEFESTAACDIAAGLVKTNGKIMGMDPSFGDNYILDYRPHWRTAQEEAGVNAEVELYVVPGSKPRIYVRVRYSGAVETIQLTERWYPSYAYPNGRPSQTYTYPLEDVDGTDGYYIPSTLDRDVYDGQVYGEIIDESGLADSGVVYEYEAVVRSSIGSITVRKTATL